MSRRLLGAGLCAGLFFALSANTLAATDQAVPASSNAPFAIFDDQSYSRDGAVTKFRTCLAIADDPKVQGVWNDYAFEEARDVPAYDLFNTMRGLEDRVRLQRGFGTLLACAQIVSSWYAKTIGADPEQPFRNRYTGNRSLDGRFEHGATIVDLGLGGGLRAFIEPVALTRILTSPGLLPKANFGGIVVRNAIVNGPLVMHNLHLTGPLAFVNVKFVGRSYAKELFDNPKTIEDMAIAIAYSQFDNHILIANSEICGNVSIRESHFVETLAFERVSQKSIGCQPIRAPLRSQPPSPLPWQRTNNDAKMHVWISSSRFDQSLSFIGTHLDFLRVSGNEIESFLASTSGFGRELRVWENDIGSLQINCSILVGRSNIAKLRPALADISYNHVKKDFFVNGTQFSGGSYGADGEGCSSWWKNNGQIPDGHRIVLKISSNKIGGGLGLEDLDGSIVQPPINLSSNRVGNGSIIELPSDAALKFPWRGVVTLEGSTYQGKIEITHSSTAAPTKTDRDDGDYCEPHDENPPRVATIDLTATSIRTLKWDLPFVCDYRWRGYGLTYDLWQAGAQARKSADFRARIDDQSILPFWRQMLEVYEPASLNAMSRYLADKGSSVTSRGVLLEAKRLNYAPACPPDQYALGCPFSMEWKKSARVPKEVPDDAGDDMVATAGGTDDVWLASMFASISAFFWLAKDYVVSILMLFFLWPGGYGAAPEQAIFLIGILAVFFYYVYWRYSEGLKGALDRVPRYIDDVSWIKTTTLADIARLKKAHQELGEGQPPEFDYDLANVRQSQAAWPSDEPDPFPWPALEEWSSLDRQKRLTVIQDVLLPATKDRHADTSEDVSRQRDLNELRIKLENFGNTETLGFSLFDRNKMPTRFTHWLYSVDTMLPFIDLHAYGNYYPESGWIRTCSVVQHVLGWWLITVFIASAAIL